MSENWNAFGHSADAIARMKTEDEKSWRRYVGMDDYSEHVYPLRDEMEHEMSGACPCNPSFETWNPTAWSSAARYIHKAADGRIGPEESV